MSDTPEPTGIPAYILDLLHTAENRDNVLVLVEDRSQIRDRMADIERWLTAAERAGVTRRSGEESIRVQGRGRIIFRGARGASLHLRGMTLGLVVAPFRLMNRPDLLADLMPALATGGRLTFTRYES